MADSEEDSPVVGAVLALLPRIPPAGDEVLSQVMTAVGIFAEKTSGENIGPLGKRPLLSFIIFCTFIFLSRNEQFLRDVFFRDQSIYY